MSVPDPKQQQKKVLRIGVIQGGRITEEQMVPYGTSVTIGDDRKNTIVLHSSGLPRRLPLITFKQGQYYLGFAVDMDGKLSMAGGVVMGLDAAKAKAVKQKDGALLFPLTMEMRGKLTIAGTTILFQFVAAQPAAVKRTGELAIPWHKRVDLTFVGIFCVSFVLHTVFILYSMSLPRPPEMTLEQIPDQFAKIIAPNNQKKKEAEKAPGEGEKPVEEKKVEEKKSDDKAEAAKDDGKPAQERPQLSEAQRIAQRKAELKQVGILKVLGAKSGGGARGGISGDNVFNQLSSGGLGEMINRNATGIASAATAEQYGLRATDNINMIGSDPVGGVGVTTQVAKETRVAKKVPKTEKGDTDAIGSLAKTSLDDVIGRNLKSITGCYDRALNLNPTLSGKYFVKFSVAGNGRVEKVDVSSASNAPVDPEMSACIKSRVKRWTFQPSEDGGATDVTLPIVLTAS